MVPAPAFAVSSMVLVQLGTALSTRLFLALTPAGSTWLRLVVAAIILMALNRPALRAIPRSVLLGAALLGGVTGLLMLTFIEAVARIPLGTAAAIEFLGPLSVAAVRRHRRLALIWPAIALLGVLLLTQPWVGHLNLPGIGFALAAAAGWAAYILLTQRMGAQLAGLQALAISLSTAAVVTAPFGAWAAITGLTPTTAAQGAGLAVLVPLLSFSFELLALRRMRVAAFGTLMALEPGIATVLGLAVLTQMPNPSQVVGVAAVVAAGVGAQRSTPAHTRSRRTADDPVNQQPAPHSG